MKYQNQMIGVVLASLLATLLVTHLNAQTKPTPAGDSPSAKGGDVVPRAALLNERGRELAEELRMLKRSRESMGSKHPTLPLINNKIEAIQEQLEAWEPAVGQPAENPFHPSQSKPQMNEYDLRQMVIKLNKRVEMLEKRIDLLEQK